MARGATTSPWNLLRKFSEKLVLGSLLIRMCTGVPLIKKRISMFQGFLFRRKHKNLRERGHFATSGLGIADLNGSFCATGKSSRGSQTNTFKFEGAEHESKYNG
ncbi:uncharacterized protein LOC108907595 [Anoplophora glabripennis]|uniref:uncharacterized protein LOC108907595 n=1 Tax=Anoplophora glabripennis TaxID=217634 RepID=UPI0008737791|nr:uncharacterized protein LOC108907595 [Anoplophora glabripennis]